MSTHNICPSQHYLCHAEILPLIYPTWDKYQHTCNKFQKGIREIFISVQGGLSKMYGIYRKILNSDEGDFKIMVKSGIF